MAAHEDAARGRGPRLDRTDALISALVLAVCGTLYYLTTTFEEVSDLLAQSIGPGWFPRLVLAIIALLALALPFERALTRRRDGPEAGRKAGRTGPIRPMVYYTTALLLLVVLGTGWLGSAAAMVAVCVALPLLWGERRPAVIVPFAVLFPAAVALLFVAVLGVRFEPGTLGLWPF